MEPDSGAVKTARGSVELIAQGMANIFLGLLFFIFLVRMISKPEMGVYAALTMSYSLFQIIGSLGLNVAAARFVPKFLAEGNRRDASAVAGSLIEISIASGIALTFVFYVSAPHLSFFLTKSLEHLQVFQVCSLVVLTVVPMIVLDGLLQGVQEFGRLALVRILGQVLKIAVSFPLLLVGYGLYAVVAGWVALGVGASILSFFLLRRHLSFRVHGYRYGPVLKFSLPMLGASLVTFASGWVDMFLAMLYASLSEVGAYNVTIMASTLLTGGVLLSINSTLLPAMSRSYGSGGLKAVENAFYKSSRYMALVYTPAALGLASVATPAVWLMAGEVYQEAVLPLAVIAVGSLAFGFFTPLSTALATVGETVRVFRITLVAVVVDVLASILLIPNLSIVGAALGRALLFSASFAYGLLETKRVLKTRFDVEAAWKTILASIVMTFPVVAIQLWKASILLIPVYLAVGAGVYVSIIKILRLVNSTDILIAEKILPKSLSFIMKPVRKLFT